jgi:predicted glycosyltransferase
MTNAPHARFFKDIIDYYLNNGDDLLITTRDFGDLNKLMDDFGFDYVSVGAHGGANLSEKLKCSSQRFDELVDIVTSEKIDVALAKHSVELPRIAFGLNMPNLYVIDNEYAQAVNKITLPLCDRVIAPNVIDTDILSKYGLDPSKLIRYDGTSELMHLKNFNFNPDVFNTLKINLKFDKNILIRPEASMASYLDVNHEVSVLLSIVNTLKHHANILLLPRFKAQASIFKDMDNVTLLDPPVDVSSIIKSCDLVIGAGGTMNREAAILNTPIISCYPGKTLAVDQYYIDKGLIFKSLKEDVILDTAFKILSNDKKENKTTFSKEYFNKRYDQLFNLIIDNLNNLAKTKS